MYLQGSRGFSIVAVVLGVLSLVTGIVGLEVIRPFFFFEIKHIISLEIVPNNYM